MQSKRCIHCVLADRIGGTKWYNTLMTPSPASQTFSVPYDRDAWTFSLPPGMHGTVVEPQPMPPLPDIDAAVRAAMAAPVAGPRLRELPQVRRGATACIVVTDVTRASPDAAIVPALLDELRAGGIADKDITVLIALGMHRPSTPEER